MFRTTMNKGFQMTFENGMTISVQFGYGNYSSNRDEAPMDARTATGIHAETAEIAVWDAEGRWMNFPDEQVKGWVSADDVADYIIKVKNATSIEELHEGKGIIWATEEED
jgi:hypothetical protein